MAIYKMATHKMAIYKMAMVIKWPFSKWPWLGNGHGYEMAMLQNGLGLKMAINPKVNVRTCRS